ncbi:MAG: DUF3866 family protein [Actinomycetota bacterium]|nr:DUF3866 family protein [Actinomycetota bacterium]
MAAFREGTVVRISERSERVVRVQVEIGTANVEAIGFPSMLGVLENGDRVVVNTTGIEMHLGTGGVGFVLWNLDGGHDIDPGPGHIMKMRYTPWQTEVSAVEAPESAHHGSLASVDEIGGMPVVACGLHSQIAGVAAGIRRRRPDAVIGYLMTDAGALPLAFSELVHSLQQSGLIDATCTSGHAFGGDLEAVNLFSGLAALRVVAGSDVVIAAMGPGLAGTGTVLGFSGIEQGQIVDATNALGGRPFACLRVSFGDERVRHQGLSHHTVTALTLGCRTPATIGVPDLADGLSRTLWSQLGTAGIDHRHELVAADGTGGKRLLEEKGLDVLSMGRSMHRAPEAVLAAAAVGGLAAEAIRSQPP